MDDDFEPEDHQEEVIYLDEVQEVSVEEYIEDLDISVDDEPECQPEIIDLSVLTFQNHKKSSVFCSDLTNDGQLAITGGEDDTAFLWKTENGEVVFECTGHKDSVVEVCFNFDNQYVATGDMKGMIQVWNVQEKTLVWCHECDDDLEWLFWHPLTNVLFCGSRNGDVSVWQIPQGNCKMLYAHNNSPALCSKLLPDLKHILVGYENGQLKLWIIRECKTCGPSICLDLPTMDIDKEGTLAIVAPGSILVKLADGKIITTLLAGGETDVEEVLFNKELGNVATGSISGKLCVWELGHHVLRHEANIQCAVTVMKWGSNCKIFIGASDAAVYVCDVKTGTLLHKLTGHKSEILSISVFKNCSNQILTTSDDGTAKIFNIKID
ncbi:LOW QUALITY PROTEIN: angio-associated migratory cell protein [Leptinotarsa decemlineata]|uniref:LOW QUALITY PROTEIN: angio-associated migratory cell protein n=1 Tax=Leptinotarsa decemlineata TaxID=7539 RepID=UPI003D30A686